MVKCSKFFVSIGFAHLILISSIPNQAIEPVTAPGAQLEKLTDSCSFTEGPIADALGNVYFTDQPNDRILIWTIDNRLETFMQPAGRSNGLYFDRDGNLIACADEKNQLWLIPLYRKPRILVDKFEGKLLNGPNDVWVRPDNGIYFTDPYYKRPYWNRGPMEQDGQHVYFLSPDRKRLIRVIEDLKQPNGIIGTPDGRILYVADIGAARTYAYEIQPDGLLKNKRIFCEIGSDGMTIDEEGNVYLTGKEGVIVFNSAGYKIQVIHVPEPWTANVCFGGPEMDYLYITASKCLYRIKMRVRGVRW